MIGSVDAASLGAMRDTRRALMAFSIYNLEQGLGVVQAAEAERLPVLLQAGASAFGYAGRESLAGLALGLAADSEAAVGVHLDHAVDLAEIEHCLELGYTSVMFDGSARPLAENIRLTRRVVELAHHAGAWVEGELAGFAGAEDVSTEAQATAFTDPDVAERFVDETGVDALAVAVGNVHGVPARPIRLDLSLLERIATHVSIPLVLHGASGVPLPDLKRAIQLGVAKLNVNTELRHALRDALVEGPHGAVHDDSVASLLGGVIAATEAVAREKLRAFTADVTEPTKRGDARAGA